MNVLVRSIFCGLAFVTLAACASGREFWNSVIEDPVRKPLEKEVTDTPVATPNSPQYVKVAFNDGKTSTEVQIPILTSGQQIVIDHKGKPATAGLALLAFPPTDADKSLEDAYLGAGNTISSKATPVSIVKTQAEIKKLAKQGNYALALEYATQLLQRYPNHVETLRSKGALLLKMGESKAALDAYEKAQDVEPSNKVQKQIDELRRAEEKRP